MQSQALNLDPEQVLAIVIVTDYLGNMAKSCHPQGNVKKFDASYCTSLHSVQSIHEKRIDDHLLNWQGFSEHRVRFHDCDGNHAEILNSSYVKGSERLLSGVPAARGI